jgi:hypothetical protein
MISVMETCGGIMAVLCPTGEFLNGVVIGPRFVGSVIGQNHTYQLQ